MLLLIWTVTLVVAFSLYFRRVYSKFSRRGVKTLRPVPILGNTYGVVTGQNHFLDDFRKLYFKFPEERFVGRYEFLNPIVVAKDLELIKKVTLKDFEYFIDHRRVNDEKMEPLFGRNLFSLRGQEWKDMRSTLTPTFTSSKIKQMMPFMVEVGEQMMKVLEEKIEAAGGDLDLEVKDLTSRYANDVIASCAFGLKVNSLAEDKNIFYEMGKSVSSIKFKQLFIFIFYASFPALITRLNITIFTKAARKFFKDLVLDTMGHREAKNIIRPDMINLLMQIKKSQLSQGDRVDDDAEKDSDDDESVIGKKIHNTLWSDDDLVAQAVLFFMAGFETVSSTMSFALHEIAMHPKIQERLLQEIRETDAKNNGKIDYNTIQNMTYMDMVVSETLRKWPALAIMDRLCIKDYNMGKPNEKSEFEYIIQKGDCLVIPTWAIHRDPKYFPNPEKFDPERFSEENKHNINPVAYLPFGLGPRNCIGMRFGLCEVKVLLYQLLLRIEISPSKKLRTPVTLCKTNFLISIDGGHWVKFKFRK